MSEFVATLLGLRLFFWLLEALKALLLTWLIRLLVLVAPSKIKKVGVQ